MPCMCSTTFCFILVTYIFYVLRLSKSVIFTVQQVPLIIAFSPLQIISSQAAMLAYLE